MPRRRQGFFVRHSIPHGWFAFIIFGCVIAAIILFRMDYQDRHPPEYDLSTRDDFMKAVLENDINGHFDPKPIRKVCDGIKWQRELTFVCEAPQGGVGNVRNVFLGCLRYTIEAGGMCLLNSRER